MATPRAAIPQVAIPWVATPRVAIPQVTIPQVAVPRVAAPRVAVSPHAPTGYTGGVRGPVSPRPRQVLFLILAVRISYCGLRLRFPDGLYHTVV